MKKIRYLNDEEFEKLCEVAIHKYKDLIIGLAKPNKLKVEI